MTEGGMFACLALIRFDHHVWFIHSGKQSQKCLLTNVTVRCQEQFINFETINDFESIFCRNEGVLELSCPDV